MTRIDLDSHTPGHGGRQTPLIAVVCPWCHGGLRRSAAKLTCQRCDAEFEFTDGYPDLIVGERFADDTAPELLAYEDECNRDTTQHYWLPLFQTLFPDGDVPRRVLSVGCGTGVDVDLLQAHGFESMGIDCGNRSHVWPHRHSHDRLLLANGQHLPFEDRSFDIVFCGCVFPHVGVVGDSYRVTPHYDEERRALAHEMTRVLDRGGKIIVSSPNRYFPFDIFHGRESGSYKPRPYWPGDPFLLSIHDYRRLFQAAGCARIHALPVERYWGFIRAKNSTKGRVVTSPVRLIFWLVSRPSLGFLRPSPINPWIIVMAEKAV